MILLIYWGFLCKRPYGGIAIPLGRLRSSDLLQDSRICLAVIRFLMFPDAKCRG